MVYRKGQRTNKHVETAYPFVVDIQIPPGGLGQHADKIVEAARLAGGEHQCYSNKDDRENPLLVQDRR